MRGLIAEVSSWSWAELGSRMAGFMFVWATIQQLFPHRFRVYIGQLSDRLIAALYPYMQITIHEYSSNGRSNEVYAAAKAYLGSKSNNQRQAKCLQAEMVKNSKSFLISLDTSEEVTDDFFNGGGTIKLWWALREKTVSKKSFSLFPSASEEFQKMYYKLTFHRRYKDVMTGPYLQHVVQEGKAIEHRNRQRKLYTNSWRGYWSPIVFEHPATFQTLAMDAKRKEEIMDDLVMFSKGGEYYSKVGKAWKRGYLLYGPPGTGKSTMIAAIANFLSYDVYDLELTSVRSNTELRQLLIDTKSKSVIVIEDIDCSLDLTCKRKSSKNSTDLVEESIKKEREEEGGGGSRVTLSGLLNFIDGIWSACGAERMIVFTTNHVDKLDPALIRRGRMDMHIEMSYCKFEAFKVLAKNYLDIESHALFGTIERLLEESSMSPCDVAESLIQKTAARDVEACLNDLIGALNRAKKNAILKAGKEAELRAKENSHWMKKIGGKLRKQID